MTMESARLLAAPGGLMQILSPERWSAALFLSPLLQPAQVHSIDPGRAQLAGVRRPLLASGPEVLAPLFPGDVRSTGIVAAPPVEFAARTQVLDLDFFTALDIVPGCCAILA